MEVFYSNFRGTQFTNCTDCQLHVTNEL